MGPAPNLDWAFWAAAGVLAAAGVALLAWALLWDRSRGRRRCPKCWYSMEGAAGSKCPECGREARSERSLLRTRRRWGWATVAAGALVAAAVIGYWPTASRRGWMSAVPTRVVIELAPIGGMEGPFGHEVLRRLGLAPWPDRSYVHTMTEGQRVALLRRIARGNALARPVDERWQASYGALLRRTQFRLFSRQGDGTVIDPVDGEASDELAAAVAALMDLPYILTVRTRDRWPVGIPVLLDVRVDHWWPGCTDLVKVRWTATGGEAQGAISGRGHVTADIPVDGEVDLDLELDVVQQDLYLESRPERTVGHERRRVSYRTVASIEDVVRPVSSPQIDAMLASGVIASHDDVLLSLIPRTLSGPAVDGVGFGVFADVMHGDEVVAKYRVRWLGGVTRTITSGLDMEDWPGAIARIWAARGQPGWTVRLRSDPGWALYEIDADRYWQGEIVLPLEIRGVNEPSPPPRPAGGG